MQTRLFINNGSQNMPYTYDRLRTGDGIINLVPSQRNVLRTVVEIARQDHQELIQVRKRAVKEKFTDHTIKQLDRTISLKAQAFNHRISKKSFAAL